MSIMNKFIDFCKKFFKGAIREQLDIIIPIARDVVRAIAADPSLVTSDAKRAMAFNMIMVRLAEQELKFAGRLINLAIEMAVVEFRGIDDEN
jgi:hypothetical protein